MNVGLAANLGGDREPVGRSPSRGLSLRDATEFRRMAEIIKARIAGRSVAYFTNPGNLGDALIEAGSLAFLEANGIPFQLQNARRLRELHARHYRLAYAKNLSLLLLTGGRYRKYTLSLPQIAAEHGVAVLCGSGGFSAQAHVAMQIHALCCGYFSDVIVLPSTYSLAPHTQEHSLFFARDRYESLTVVPSATFCHDMAFFLSPAQVETRRRVGYHIRTDNESAGDLPIPAGNFDVSADGTELDPVDRVFDEVGRSEIVVTDRLHVCIAAALLGRRVYLFRGNYFKIEAIYRSSLEPHFPNVTLLADWSDLPAEARP